MSEKYVAECISCGEAMEFAELEKLQEAIYAGDVGEYICSQCQDREGVGVDE